MDQMPNMAAFTKVVGTGSFSAAGGPQVLVTKQTRSSRHAGFLTGQNIVLDGGSFPGRFDQCHAYVGSWPFSAAPNTCLDISCQAQSRPGSYRAKSPFEPKVNERFRPSLASLLMARPCCLFAGRH